MRRIPARDSNVARSRIDLIALLPLATGVMACGPQDTTGRLTVRSVEVRATGEDGVTKVAGAIDSTWVVPGDGEGAVTRSLSFRPVEGDGLEGSRLDRVLEALATQLVIVPQDDPPGELDGTEARSNWLLEAPLGQGVTFRAQIPTHYVRRPDTAWNGSGVLDRDLHWVVAGVTPTDTVDLRLQGQYRDLREPGGLRTASVEAEGTLRVASVGGTYQLIIAQESRTTPVSGAAVGRSRERARDGLSNAGAASES